MMKLAQEFFLIHNRVDAALGYNSCLGHFFHGIEGLFFSHLDTPHLAKAASADHILKVEVVLVYFYTNAREGWLAN